jgi:hypothetical protein
MCSIAFVGSILTDCSGGSDARPTGLTAEARLDGSCVVVVARTLNDASSLTNNSNRTTDLAVDTSGGYVVLDAVSPILCLPPELLAYVMELASFRIARWDEDDWINRGLHDWIPFIHDQRQVAILSLVCRAWRALALETACLWSAPRLQLDAERESYICNPLCFERSQQSLISIVDDHSDDSVSAALDLVPQVQNAMLTAELMSRVRDLWLPCGASLAQMDSPALESLIGRPPRGSVGEVELPRYAPHLRTLLLHDVHLCGTQLDGLVGNPLLAQLRRLAVAFHADWWQDRQDLLHLLSIVQCTPLLTDLAIRNHLRTLDMEWDVTNMPLRDVVVLPHLRRITLVGDQIFMVALLQHIQMPADVEIWLQPADTVDPDNAELEVQMQFVQLYLSHPAQTPVKLVLKPMAVPSHDKGRHSWRESMDVELYHADGRRMLCLPLRLPRSHDEYMSRLTALADALLWTSVAEVHLRTPSAPPAALLHKLLRAPRLAVLHARETALSEIAAFLPALSENSGGAHAPEPCLPVLHTLVAVGVPAGDLEHVKELLRARKNMASVLTFEALESEDAGPVQGPVFSQWTSGTALPTLALVVPVRAAGSTQDHAMTLARLKLRRQMARYNDRWPVKSSTGVEWEVVCV